MIAEGTIIWGEDGQRGANDERINQLSRDTGDWVRQVRGGYLSGAFGIERNLSAAIIHYFLGTRILIDEVQEAFDQAVLQTLNFYRKIGAADLIARRCFNKDTASHLVKGLREIKSVRNVLAHQPFALHPQFNDDGTLYCLTPVMKHGQGSLIITSAFVKAQNLHMKAMLRLSERLIVAVLVNGGMKMPSGVKTDDFRPVEAEKD